jgi:hypothetical protein
VNKPNVIESVRPRSGQYSPSADWKLHAWLVVAAVLAVASDYLLRHHPDWSLLLRVVFALCPLAPCLLYARSWVRFVRGMDELQRRIQIESRLVACLGTLLVVTPINALNSYGIPLPVFSRGLGFMGTLILAGIFWRIASTVINRRYK